MALLAKITEEMKVANVSLRDAVPCGVVQEAIIYQGCESVLMPHAFRQVIAPAISIQAGQAPAGSALNFSMFISEGVGIIFTSER